MFEDGVLHILLQKALTGVTWTTCCKGHAGLSAKDVEKENQKILLERFQREVRCLTHTTPSHRETKSLFAGPHQS
jgi:hypothetical protein